jgi:hypothetical protein
MSSGARIALDDRRSHARAFHATPSEPPPTIGFVMPFFATDGLWCQSCISSLVVAYLRAYGSDRIELNRRRRRRRPRSRRALEGRSRRGGRHAGKRRFLGPAHDRRRRDTQTENNQRRERRRTSAAVTMTTC